jgi:hypothetical protein
MSDRLGSISESYKGEQEEEGEDGSTGESGEDSASRKDGKTGLTGSSSKSGSTGKDTQTGSDGKTDSETTASSKSKSSGNIKDKNPVLAMYPPEEVKEKYESTWDDIQVLCKLADIEQPRKISEYSAAVLENGCSDLERLCQELGLTEAYDEYSSVIED